MSAYERWAKPVLLNLTALSTTKDNLNDTDGAIARIEETRCCSGASWRSGPPCHSLLGRQTQRLACDREDGILPRPLPVSDGDARGLYGMLGAEREGGAQPAAAPPSWLGGVPRLS
jgi:hypothetical protein